MNRVLSLRRLPAGLPALAPVLLLAATAAPARADLLVGQVVDSFGVGVQGVDIDVKNLGSGGDPTISNDGTDAGGFFAVTIPAGLYDVIFNPPPPPATSHLILEVQEVPISGTKDLGVVSLPPGVAVSGRALNQAGLPVAGLDIDVVDETTGDALDLISDTSNAFGEFAVAVPAGPIEFRLDTSTVQTQTLAAVAFQLDPSADVDLGDVTLLPGFRINGTLTTSGGAPLVGIDFDVEDAATGADLYVPKDNSQAGGAFSLVVPSGTWDVSACPPLAQALVAHEEAVTVAGADVSIGTIALSSGVLLSGQVTNSLGQPVPGVDVDVDVAGTGLSIALCNDNTNASGSYSVIVPTGSFDVSFSPPMSQPYASDLVAGVSVFGSTVVDGIVDDCPFGSSYGAGKAGLGGFVPVLATIGGAPRVGNDSWAYAVTQAPGGTVGLVLVGLGPLALPVWGGTLLVDITQFNVFLPAIFGGTPGVGGAGSATAALPVPIGPSFVGLTLYAQTLVSDPSTVAGIGLTQGRSVTFCD